MEISTAQALFDLMPTLITQHKKLLFLVTKDQTLNEISELASRHPSQIMFFEPAESSSMLAYAAGAAQGGQKVVVVSSATLFLKNLLIIKQNICLDNLAVTLIARKDSGLTQNTNDLALLRSIPELTLISPADYQEAGALLNQALDLKKPSYVRLDNSLWRTFYNEQQTFEIGRPESLLPGRDLTLFCTGSVTVSALMAAETVRSELNKNIQVVNIATLNPLHSDQVIECLQQTKIICTFEDHLVNGGLGSLIAEIVSELKPLPVFRFGLSSSETRSGELDDLQDFFDLSPARIYLQLKKLLEKI